MSAFEDVLASGVARGISERLAHRHLIDTLERKRARHENEFGPLSREEAFKYARVMNMLVDESAALLAAAEAGAQEGGK